MLPLEKPWYRKLIFFALVLGGVSGLLVLLFMSITDTGTSFFFGDTGAGWWSGNWWWIPLTAVGGLLVSLLRKAWKIPPKVPGAIALANQAWVDPAQAPQLVIISAVSLIVGASLGPSFALVVMGGGLGSWLVGRLGEKDSEESKQEFALTGMASGLGASFTAPLFATILTSELSPTAKRNYVAAFIPQLIAATIGFAIFFSATGSSILGSYELPPYDFGIHHILIGALLGILSAFVLIIFALVKKLVTSAADLINNPYVLGIVAGGLVGLIAFALPLTATSGSTQLATELQLSPVIGIGLITAVLFGKMFAIALSQSAGFLGGVVFPIIFIGGTAGVLVNHIFPEIPIALAVAAMLAAVPGAFLKAPLTLIFIAVGTVGIDPTAMIPIPIAVITAHLTISLIQTYITKKRQIEMQAKMTD